MRRRPMGECMYSTQGAVQVVYDTTPLKNYNFS